MLTAEVKKLQNLRSSEYFRLGFAKELDAGQIWMFPCETETQATLSVQVLQLHLFLPVEIPDL